MSVFADLATLVVRLVAGGAFAAHGAQKAFGAFAGPGPAGAAAFMEGLGFRPGATYGRLASYTELGAGTLVALGALGPVGPAAMIAVMIVAQTSAHGKNGFFAQKNGVEIGVLYAAIALLLAARGFGRFSLDAELGSDLFFEDDRLAFAVVGAAVATSIFVLSRRVYDAPDASA